MCQRHYVGIPAGFEASNSFTESENARLYRGPTGAKANNKLHVAGKKIVMNTNKAYQGIISRDVKNSQKTVIPKSKRVDINECVYSELSKCIVPHMCKKAYTQYDNAKKYYKFFCDLDEDQEKIFLVKSWRMDYKMEERGPRPIYHQTHFVKADMVNIDSDDFWCLKCDCGYYTSHKCPCLHVYAIFARKPIKEDFYPECTHLYAKWFAEKDRECFTSQCTVLQQRINNCGGLLLSTSMNVFGPNALDGINQLNSRTLFEVGIGRLNDVNPNNSIQQYDTIENSVAEQSEVAPLALNYGGKTRSGKKMSAYNEHMPKYQEMCNLATSGSDRAIIVEGMNKIIQNLYKEKRGDVPPPDQETVNGLAALYSGPNMEKAPKRKRLGKRS